jgi:hypothetical protein
MIQTEQHIDFSITSPKRPYSLQIHLTPELVYQSYFPNLKKQLHAFSEQGMGHVGGLLFLWQ